MAGWYSLYVLKVEEDYNDDDDEDDDEDDNDIDSDNRRQVINKSDAIFGSGHLIARIQKGVINTVWESVVMEFPVPVRFFTTRRSLSRWILDWSSVVLVFCCLFEF